MGWLEGKVALVVGGGSGIGRAVVDAFVDEGARVGVLELDPGRARALEVHADRVRAVVGDATTWEDNLRAVRATVEAFGGLDVLATFVGVFDFYTRLEDIPADRLAEACAEVFRTNVASSLLSTKAALPELLRRPGSSVVFTVSTSGFYPGRGGVLYVASKFAVRGLVVQLAHELAPRVRVNGVAPGGTLGTSMRGLATLGLSDRRLADLPGREEELRARTPLRVALRPEDHAAAYVYLSSDRARGVTGTILHSDGGVGVRG
ncbi:Cis-toluene dihydrodiol dehydrogenase [bacterium HR32]|nr:Cis-toluene dihydrodiol dehydrogenase [bacterium HR32]